MSEKIRWQRVNEEPFEYAIQQGPHGDEFVKLLDGTCLRRASSPAQEPVTTEPIGQDGPCFYCGEVTSCFAGDPGMWPLRFSQADGTGITHIHHTRCVTDRLAIPAPPQPGREWQPIETAPSDGTQVLVCGGYLDGVQMRGADGDWWRMSKKDGNRATPTHWQSLPTPYTGEPK